MCIYPRSSDKHSSRDVAVVFNGSNTDTTSARHQGNDSGLASMYHHHQYRCNSTTAAATTNYPIIS
ncbi:hypothetical protein E2C01_076322 [Portunus trituberculatus]|uniref:Uncharacterized protein n=1 Tax=Portunus trituberculatus TaxID=210409 RepID=A0A5B7I8G2_PORTR|nr:hypothetical protein [Portunus trituberculatus]